MITCEYILIYIVTRKPYHETGQTNKPPMEPLEYCFEGTLAFLECCYNGLFASLRCFENQPHPSMQLSQHHRLLQLLLIWSCDVGFDPWSDTQRTGFDLYLFPTLILAIPISGPLPPFISWSLKPCFSMLDTSGGVQYWRYPHVTGSFPSWKTTTLRLVWPGIARRPCSKLTQGPWSNLGRCHIRYKWGPIPLHPKGDLRNFILFHVFFL